MSVPLYHLGLGRQSDILWHDTWNDKLVADAVAGLNSSLRANNLQLILGITASGASHLLLTCDQLSALSKHSNFKKTRSSHSPEDYESLSPISFQTAEDLLAKLTQLRKYSRKQETPLDSIAKFEQARTFYRVLNNTIESKQDLRQFNVLDTAWKHNIRVCAFAFNTGGLASEARTGRIQRPNILDIGWAEASLPSFSKKEGNAHIKVARNKYIQISGKVEEKFDEEDGTTEYLDNDDIKCRFEEFLAGHLSSTAKEPLILLVYDEEVSRHALRYLGFDLSEWKSGIKDLLNGGKPSKCDRPLKYSPSIHSKSKMSNYVQNDNKYRAKSRSRSPHELKYSSKRQPSPPRERTYPPGYIIDLKEMYTAMMTGLYGIDGFRGIATNLGFLGDCNDSRNVWCAGNEAGFAFDIWRSMITGPAINEQLSEKLAIANNLSEFAVAGSSNIPDPSIPVDDEDDEDPNTYASLQQSSSIPTNASIRRQRAPFEPDSESDYGSD